MRRFRDGTGREWDVILGRESWGTHVALFVPRDGGPQVRQAPLAAAAYDVAVQELDGMDDAALQALLDGSSEKEEGR
jgi:hypothetical protein